MRSALLRAFPYHVLLVYLAPWLAFFVRRKQADFWRALPVALALSAAGILEFVMSVLTDALDNARHLFIFQTITDLLVILISCSLLLALHGVLEKRAPVGALLRE